MSTETQPPVSGLSDEGIAPQLLELDASQASALLLKKSRPLSIVRPTIAGADAGDRHRLPVPTPRSDPMLRGLSGATLLLEATTLVGVALDGRMPECKGCPMASPQWACCQLAAHNASVDYRPCGTKSA
eukprot:CAMPEP_0172673154 /NCGR_PEP_ID=MMETSP1074-20121228/11976_1 /TAXON_ID=2916 /ORGANISM="Ceratium fusus, Strain PA161109" /LENGTH=128 /DNA_ID=CAMNT_0013490423 /DNA_START=1340 /DNA_END=1722 /DNA_ORIENTATION=+